MNKMLYVAMATALFAGCGESDSSSDSDTTDPTVDPVASAAIAVGDVTSASFDATAGTLTVQIPLDTDTALESYVAAGDLNGYSRFTQQDDPLDRSYTAFAAESDDGSVQAVVVMDGGQFNRFFGGAAINQDSYTAPTSGLASYAGAYVGLTNLGEALPIPAGADDSLTPYTTTEVTGTVFLNADFVGNNVNGAIYDRMFDPDDQAIALQTIVLTNTSFGADGSFTGTVEFEDLTGVGSYEGTFAGADAANVAGIVSLGEGFLEGATVGGVATTVFDDIENEQEIGIFIIGQCASGAADCFGAEGIND